MYLSKNKSVNLNQGQLVLARCPEWCQEGLQVASWDGEQFTYDADPNGSFNNYVIAFMPINEEGEPINLKLK